MRRFTRLLLISLLALSSCADPPVDPEGTLDRIRGQGVLRAGITENEPWTALTNGEPSGVEVELIEQFADELEAPIKWVPGSEEQLFGALELGQLDVVVGGFSSENAWAKHAAFTHPYYTSQIVIAVPTDMEVPDDIANTQVSVEPYTPAAGLLREKTDAQIIYVEDTAEAEAAVAVDSWLLDDLELRATDITLSESDHVMAVRFGENGWMVTLEKFLLENAGAIPRLLDDAEDA